jgi:hypothetical protein
MNARTWCSAVVACTFATAAMAQSVEKYNAPPMGSSWTYQYRNSGAYTGPAQTSSKMAETTYKGQPHLAFQGSGGTLVAQRDGAWVAMLAPDGKPVTTWEPNASYEWPLTPGKTWVRKMKVTNHAQGTVMDVESRGQVEAFEDVTVPAGTFKAVRLRISDNLGNDNTIWFGYEVGLFIKQKLTRSDKSPLGAGTREGELTAFTR